jgi:hypothetical protein
MLVPIVYAVYLLISVALTARVAKSVGVHGRSALAHLGNDEALPDSLTRPLLVGFYLINLGYASLALSFGSAPEDLQLAIQYLSLKIGLVLLILGVTHLVDMFLIDRVRSQGAASAAGSKQLYPAAAERPVTHKLQADLDVPIRIVLWAVVIVVGLVAIEPTTLYLPGSPLVGLATVSTYLALAHLAIRLTLGALSGSAGGDVGRAPEASGPVAALGPAGAMSLQIFSHGAALLLCGFGHLPTNLAQAVSYVTLRLGGLLLGLGLTVLTILYFRNAPRCAPIPPGPRLTPPERVIS